MKRFLVVFEQKIFELVVFIDEDQKT